MIFKTKNILTFFVGYYYVTYAFLLHIGYRPFFYQDLKDSIDAKLAELNESKTPKQPSSEDAGLAQKKN
ncbi:hypothetical protein AYI68_g204 [Smittium mucronatum]|uniref:Uncharacterized protein n=1 Tax=Smittium mucronatum TaxID=133383 RepID=A0A1R0H8U0_9FUNG|nr:hypothetical protein AYI68_g204 [Smittium mucronatum]